MKLHLENNPNQTIIISRYVHANAEVNVHKKEEPILLSIKQNR